MYILNIKISSRPITRIATIIPMTTLRRLTADPPLTGHTGEEKKVKVERSISYATLTAMDAQ